MAGLIECAPGHSRLVTTPHPVSCEGQTNIVSELVPGETLGEFLRREVPDWTSDAWEVHVNGVMVPYEFLERVKPKDMTVIEVRGIAKKQALYIVAFIALSYFTMGIGSAAGAGLMGGAGIAGVVGGVSGALLAGAVFVAGSILINKVLGPKPPSNDGGRDRDSVFSIGSGRNQARPNQPLPLVFGTVKFAPDVVSMPSWWYQNNDQYMGMVLTPGIGVASFEPLTNGDALLSSFQGVQVWQNGFSGMPDQVIPISTNVDTIAGGELNKNRTWVQRTTSTNTVRIEVNIEYSIGDANSKGKPINNTEIVDVEWRPVGGTGFTSLGTRSFRGSDPLVQRRETMTFVVPEGQYDVRVRIRGVAVDGGGSNGVARFQFGSMASVQVDNADYAGIPRIGIQIKATGQLNGAPDEIRGVMHTEAIPVWNGTVWVNQESSNPGAQILKYARGYFDQNGKRIAGIGLPDEMIDIPALQAFMLHCAANDYQYNYRVTDVRNHEEMVNSLAMAAFGQVSWASGKMSVVWAASDQPMSGVVNMATIKQGEFQVDYTLANAADGIEYSYYDANDWTVKTLRVPAPGITTMLNPATVTGEGITSEAQAAELARWHLAQSLYQYKDISYATDIEHLSYRRMSLLSISHDLTQWGFSGRLRGVSIVGGVVSLALDEPVRAPASGNAYIGLRIPGERTYRVFQVQPFTGETTTLSLVQAWPGDAPVPGNSDANPAWDTIWCYDFKPTPGYRVRVVSIEPESDLKGARVAVVPEGPEFWNYVKTGEYIPPPNQSLLQTRPVLSQLQIGERQVVQGDTIFTELTATFEVDGPVGDVVIQMSDADGLLSEVARTTTRFASWRILAAGTYTITARGFAPDGSPGNAISIIYTTVGADSPPVLVDLFDVVEQSGGVRLYTWGWLSTTTQSADFAGVEIRYTAGTVASPDWATMSPVGNDDGYHTAPFEAVTPESGEWTFAARSRNTSGTLSIASRVVTKTLGANLGEQIGGIITDLDTITQGQVDQQAAIDQERLDRIQADIAVAEAAGEDATAKANAARDTAMAAVNALAAEVAEIVNAPQWSASETYQTGWLVQYAGRLYRANTTTTNQRPDLNPSVWQNLGEYSSVAEVAAAALTLSTANASELEAEANRINALYVRMPAGTGQLATQATVAANETASVSRDNALGSRVQTVEARMPAGSDGLATSASVTSVEQASADRDGALGQRIDTVTATANGAQSTATQALTATGENAQAITQVRNQQGSGRNLLADPNFDAGVAGSGWSVDWNPQGANPPALNTPPNYSPPSTNAILMYKPGSVTPGAPVGTYVSEFIAVQPGVPLIASAYFSTDRSYAVIGVHWFDVNKNFMAENYSEGVQGVTRPNAVLSDFTRAATPVLTPPPGYVFVRVVFRMFALTSNEPVARMVMPQLELSLPGQTVPSNWSSSGKGLSSATLLLEANQNAQITLTTNVNGYVSGMVSKNDGQRGVISFLADVFEIISTGTVGVRFTRRNGGYFMRFYAASIQLVLGINFGSGNNLMGWYGPNVGEENCTKANGTAWADNLGNVYIRGSLIAGSIRNGGYSTSQAASVTYSTGPFGTIGTPIQVNASYAVSQVQTANANASQISLGTGSTGATIQLWRSLGGGAMQLISAQNLTGTVNILNELDSPSIATFAISGSITFMDNDGGTQDRNYEIRMLNRTFQNLVVTNGVINSVVTSQSTGVITAEN